MDDKLVFGLGYIWTTFVVGVKPCAHTNSVGECSSFLSGPQKLLKNKCGELAFSLSQAHWYHICIMGCVRQPVFGQSRWTCFKSGIKVFSIATWSTLSDLIKMLYLLWREGCIHQVKSLTATKNTEVPTSFVTASYLLSSVFDHVSAKTNSPSPTPFSSYLPDCCSCTMTSDYSKRCLTACCRRHCHVNCGEDKKKDPQFSI